MSIASPAQKVKSIVLKPENFDTYNVTLQSATHKGKEGLSAVQTKDTDNDRQYTFARLKDFDFHNGTIEITLSGEPKKGAIETARGFVGIAFRVPEDTSKFEVIYLRPTNGRAEDQVRRNHSTQYVSHPGYTWPKLRKEFPEKYESYVDLVAGEWTRIKIEVQDGKAKLYVNGADQPALIINDLKQGPTWRGSIGLWIGIGTQAYFSELKVTNLD
ncbi:MAG: hypothetical protein JWM14_2101 [Chitinophagaceae bacterium]|nr:hypothetical protein [Chitinophagaceae bacterium]